MPTRTLGKSRELLSRARTRVYIKLQKVKERAGGARTTNKYSKTEKKKATKWRGRESEAPADGRTRSFSALARLTEQIDVPRKRVPTERQTV